MRNPIRLLVAAALLLPCGVGSASEAAYPGREPDAPWRRVADERIDRIRKRELRVSVVDVNGQPLPGAAVRIDQTRHEFGFGSAVQAWRLASGDPKHATYQAKTLRLFNLATLENCLKQVPWEGEWGEKYSRTNALAAADWLREQGLGVRGHVMVWPGLEKLPKCPERELVRRGSLSGPEQERVRRWLLRHIDHVGRATAGRLVCWDVVNEPRRNHDVMDALPEGEGAMAAWFRRAREIAPDARLYLNEYNVLASGGETDTPNQRLLQSQAQGLLDAGAPIDGVGLQSHFRDHLLTGPKGLWKIVDRYAAMGLDVQATEFDVDTTDEQLQADYLRDFYTAMFAHEGVSAIIMWGFWEEAHWRPNGALYRKDWAPKPAARAYRDLVTKRWWTREQTRSDPEGEAAARVFRGDHTVSATYGGVAAEAAATIDADGGEAIVRLAVLPGDYNGDRSVDLADYTVWRDSLGQEVDAPGLGADGDGDGRVTQADHAVWAARRDSKWPDEEDEETEQAAAAP